MTQRNNISPLDGRYASKLEKQTDYFSEKALMQSRCKVELLYLLALNKTNLFEALSEKEVAKIKDCITHFSQEDYLAIKEIESTTKHDVKACEIFLRKKTGIQNVNLIHFALTSEDVNNLAYTFLLRDYLAMVHLPQIESLLQKLSALADKWKHLPFPSRTHGQKASPSTAGKELAVFVNRILDVYERLSQLQFKGKLNGAVGNFSAMLSAFPDFDWLKFSKDFIERNGLKFNLATTQIEDHDTWAYYFDLSRQLNNIVVDLNVDCWLYISKDLFFEKVVAGEVGSSTMPHKVNPINFENSEGNLLLSNSLLTFMGDKLCRSRMQRDLSDSTVQRNMGVALSHSYMGLSETMRGLNKLDINEKRCRTELENSPELLAEPIQTILKTVGVQDPYNLLKQASRGSTPSKEDLVNLANGLDIPTEIKERIKQLESVEYIGDAVRICDLVLERCRSLIPIT